MFKFSYLSLQAEFATLPLFAAYSDNAIICAFSPEKFTTSLVWGPSTRNHTLSVGQNRYCFGLKPFAPLSKRLMRPVPAQNQVFGFFVHQLRKYRS